MGDADVKTSLPSSRDKTFSLFSSRRKKGSVVAPGNKSVVHSEFNHSLLLPQEERETRDDKLDESHQPAFGAPAGSAAAMSAARSGSPPSVFDNEEHQDDYTTPTTAMNSASDEPGSYDLKPPPPSVSHANVEALSIRLFSADHLDVILRDRNLSARFSRFLHQYKPELTPSLKQYSDARKALAAVDYANAIADSMETPPGHPPYLAAMLDDRFEAKMRESVEDLVEDALPAYITHRLTQLVTESLVKEVTGNNAPLMQQMIPSLAEVYCVTDPSLPDNPIVYASEEFYNTSQYGREYVIGRNCRFLQGPKTSHASVKRLIDALAAGQEVCETLLNYRRDGSPFMNLLLIAPMYDNKGQVRYFLGCQIDVSPLIEGGRGLESFQQLLEKDRAEERFGDALLRNPRHALGELGQLLGEDEANLLLARSSSRTSQDSARPTTSVKSSNKEPRRRLGMDDPASDQALWPHPSLGHSGRLPGVYQNYLLVRPFPSLRITFTSPALRIPGLLQTKFLDRIGGPHHVREGILDSLAHGTGVTAKISWLTQPPSGSDRGGLGSESKTRWIHCTPMMGSDEKVGVWMIVMVENEEVTGKLNRYAQPSSFPENNSGNNNNGNTNSNTSSRGNASAAPAPAPGAGVLGSPISAAGAASPRFTGSKLYAEYLRREGRPSTADSEKRSLSIREREKERKDVDANFRDF